MNKDKLIHYFRLLVALLLRKCLVGFLPAPLQRAIAERGFSQLVSRRGIDYTGRVYGSRFKIRASSKYAVERNATARDFEGDPIEGIHALGLKDWVMLDIGANIGAYSIGAVALGAKKVFAIEPGPFFSRLTANIELNGLGAVVMPIRMGVASERGTMSWYEDENNPGNAHLLKTSTDLDVTKIGTKLAARGVEVPVLPLDDLIAQMSIPDIDLIKIDVEGMEWEVLRSGQGLISRCAPIVVAETHRVASDMMRYDCMTPLFYFFYEQGYKSYSFLEGRFIEFIYPNFSLDTFFIKKDALGAQGAAETVQCAG